MKQDSKRLVSIGGALVLVLGAVLVFFELIEPEYATLMRTKGEIAAENVVYQTGSKTVATAQSAIAQYEAQSQGGGNMLIAQALPVHEDVAGAIAQLYGLAQNNGMTIQDLDISAPIVQQGGNSSASSTSALVGSLSMQFTVTGSYENFQAFLSGMETNIRIFDLTYITIAPGSTASGVGHANNADFLSYGLTVKTYYQVD